MIKFVNSVQDLHACLLRWQQNGHRIGLVPTMGGLHEGHLSLLSLAKAHCDKVVTTIYVNPTQFSATEDFGSYPRNLSDDLQTLSNKNVCDLVYCPQQMYLDNHATQIVSSGVALRLEADSRPHFFNGVATIILKLFNQIKPDVAIFGEKDYQQLMVIKQLVRDLDLQVEIIAGHIQREKDGLAMSTRNSYLSDNERKTASNIYRILQKTARNLQENQSVSEAINAGILELNSVGINNIDYFSINDPNTLEPIAKFNSDARMLIALYVGTTRLIDNIAVPFLSESRIHS
ncbi:pantoate--beta-alanine ligase [Alphaproteobacteria bacterium]|nr:pantoate--beta-alanine ligase [Alphaproteobacteria bacterium]